MARPAVLSSFAVTLGVLALIVAYSLRGTEAQITTPDGGNTTLVAYLPVTTLAPQEAATVHIVNLSRDQTAPPEVFMVMFTDAMGLLLQPEQRCDVGPGQICSATLSSRDCPPDLDGKCEFRAVVVGEALPCVAPDMGNGEWMVNMELFAATGVSKNVIGDSRTLHLPTAACGPGSGGIGLWPGVGSVDAAPGDVASADVAAPDAPVPTPDAPAPAPPPYRTISVELAGMGSGRVRSDPPLIDCPGDCTTGPIPPFKTITLFATPDPGSTFAGFTGDPDCADMVVDPTADKTCIATFDLLPPPPPPPAPTPPPPTPTVPAAPVGLFAAVIGDDGTIGWMDAPGLIGPTGRRDPATSYRLEVGTGPGLTDRGIFDVGNFTSVSRMDLDAGPYVVAVRGVNAVGVGPRSAEVAFLVPCEAAPGPPNNLRATVAGHTVTLQWDRSTSCGAASYLVEAGPAGATTPTVATSIAGTLLVVPDVPSGIHLVRVSGVNGFGTGVPSLVLTVEVP